MDLLSRPFDADRAQAQALPWAPLAQVGAAALALVTIGHWGERFTESLLPLGRAMGTAAAHGALIASGAIIACEGRGPWWPATLRVAGALLVASAATSITPWGGLAYLLVPVILVRLAWPVAALRRLGLVVPALRPVIVGLAAGGFLGIHLLASASLTWGYTVRLAGAGGYLAAVAYDVGASALSAEWLFRGALFSLWWRRGRLGWAMAGSTALALVRYLVDPALPRTLEVAAGAIFYLGLLGVTACALRAWSGSLLPGYLATLAFFAAYRMLGEW